MFCLLGSCRFNFAELTIRQPPIDFHKAANRVLLSERNQPAAVDHGAHVRGRQRANESATIELTMGNQVGFQPSVSPLLVERAFFVKRLQTQRL